MKQNNTKTIISFAKKMNLELPKDPNKINWEDSDVWWLLSKMAHEFNAMDKLMNIKAEPKEIEEKAACIANFAMIISERYKNKR